jgi:hypothetical protein
MFENLLVYSNNNEVPRTFEELFISEGIEKEQEKTSEDKLGGRKRRR